MLILQLSVGRLKNKMRVFSCKFNSKVYAFDCVIIQLGS